MKLRGQMSVPGMHTFRINDTGLQAFSRTLGLTGKKAKAPDRRRLSTGTAVLDEMLGGGVPEGDSILVAGSSGTGKSLLATQFIAAGLRAGEPGIVAVFEERPEEYAQRASSFGLDLETPQKDGGLGDYLLRPLDLSVDEMMQELIDAVQSTGAKRLVIDSLAGFEMALAPGFRTDFRESLYRMAFALTGGGITILSTLEMKEHFDNLLFSSYSISFLTDDILRMRYLEGRRSAQDGHDGSQDAWWCPQQRHSGVRDHVRRHRDRRTLEGVSPFITGLPERVSSLRPDEPLSNKLVNRVFVAAELTNHGRDFAQDAAALNQALIRQHELTEAAELLNAQLQAEMIARKKAEEALINSEKLASVGRKAAVLAHEINHPLEAVMNTIP